MDTWLSNNRHRFELGWGVIAEGRVTTHPIVEHFDVLEDFLPRFFTREVTPMMDQFLLECAEEALHAGVVPTVALATHRTFDAVLPQDLLVARSGVLAAPVRVMQESGAGLAAPQRHRECLLGEIDREPLPHRPADDLAGKEVEHHGEIEPALVRPDVGDVAGPYPVWLLDPKLPVQGVGRHRELVARFGRGTPLLHGL